MVEWDRLLSGCWVFSSTEGSNPSLPADKKLVLKKHEFFLNTNKAITVLMVEGISSGSS